MVKMVLGSSDAQGQTMSSVGKARVTAYNSAVQLSLTLMEQVTCKGVLMTPGNNME